MNNKVIVITGASSGIGAAVAVKASALGNSVVLAARREKELQDVAATCGERAIAVTTDVTDRESVDSLLRATIEQFGRVDVWINNAGRGITKRVLELEQSDIEDMMRVNLLSALYGMQAAIPQFIKQRSGHLINVSSFLAKVPMAPMRSAYSASKAALNSLTETMRFDLGTSYPEIHLTVVMPGLVSTDFAKNANHGKPPAMPLPANYPAPQSAEEVADAIISAIQEPRDEVFTNPASLEIVKKQLRSLES